jgi:hypothetical protein
MEAILLLAPMQRYTTSRGREVDVMCLRARQVPMKAEVIVKRENGPVRWW